MAIEYEGVIMTVDPDSGEEMEIYPTVKVDSTVSIVGKPADAGSVRQIVVDAMNEAKTSVEVDTTLSVSGKPADSKTVGDKLKTLEEKDTVSPNEMNVAIENVTNKLSHVGMIIHTTTLDTMEKVIAIYGGTAWEKIEGMFLLGQSADYEINTTGGEAEHTLTVDEMPSHTHIQNAHSHTYSTFNKDGSASSSSGAGKTAVTKNTSSVTATNQNTGGSQPHNNMPPYKVVYIWERTE